MPVSYLGTEGILDGLNVGDPFFNKLGATITERTYCASTGRRRPPVGVAAASPG